MNRATAALLGFAVASSVIGCSTADTGGTESAEPASESPTLEETLTGRMEVEQRTYRPGDRVEVRWPGEELRGIAYALDAWTGSDWETRYYISAVAQGYRSKQEPTWWDVDEPGHGWVDIGIVGPGPDVAVVPDTAEPGAYRLCTANSPEQSCVVLTVG